MKKRVQETLNVMLDKTEWNLKVPNLIISVTGGAKKFTLPKRTEKALKKGIYKTASSTGAWIITGGSNCGVMQLVGEALEDEIFTENIVLIGIASWTAVYHSQEIVIYRNFIIITD